MALLLLLAGAAQAWEIAANWWPLTVAAVDLTLMDMSFAALLDIFTSDVWNQGFATEAACAVREYAFTELHLPQLISLIRVGNLASRRVAEKVGMQLMAEPERYGIRYWQFALDRSERA